MQSAFALPATWSIIRSTPAPAHWNMAVDQSMMSRARDTDDGLLRVYSWSHPAITFGRNEAVIGRFDRSALESSNFDLVRRPTGGRALLHRHEVTYAIALRLRTHDAWRPLYDAINDRLRTALRTLGIDAHIVGDAETAAIPPSGAICFAAPAAGEIVVNGGKIVASAVWRDRETFLQQGSILLDGDQAPLEHLAVFGAPPAQVSTVRGCGISAGFDEVADTLIDTMTCGTRAADITHDAQLQRDAESCVNLFRDASWLWRR